MCWGASLCAWLGDRAIDEDTSGLTCREHIKDVWGFRLLGAGLVLGWSVKPESCLGRIRNYEVEEMHGGNDQVLDLRNCQMFVFGFFLVKLKKRKGLR